MLFRCLKERFHSLEICCAPQATCFCQSNTYWNVLGWLKHFTFVLVSLLPLFDLMCKSPLPPCQKQSFLTSPINIPFLHSFILFALFWRELAGNFCSGDIISILLHYPACVISSQEFLCDLFFLSVGSLIAESTLGCYNT